MTGMCRAWVRITRLAGAFSVTWRPSTSVTVMGPLWGAAWAAGGSVPAASAARRGTGWSSSAAIGSAEAAVRVRRTERCHVRVRDTVGAVTARLPDSGVE